MSAFESLEQLLLTLRTCFVYKLPPLKSATAGQQAGNWDLGNPMLTAELRVYQQNHVGFIRLYEKKGINTRLFAQCRMDLATGKPVQAWMEPVTDSSRYFVLRCEDEATGRKASVGIGFGQREESFSFKATIQDIEGAYQREVELGRRQNAVAARRQLHNEETRAAGGGNGDAADAGAAPVEEVDLLNDPTLDFSFSANQKITVKTNFAGHVEHKPRRTGPAPSGSAAFALAPPPRAGSKYVPQGRASAGTDGLAANLQGMNIGGGGGANFFDQQPMAPMQQQTGTQALLAHNPAPSMSAGEVDLLGMNFGAAPAPVGQSAAGGDDDWGDFVEG